MSYYDIVLGAVKRHEEYLEKVEMAEEFMKCFDDLMNNSSELLEQTLSIFFYDDEGNTRFREEYPVQEISNNHTSCVCDQCMRAVYGL